MNIKFIDTALQKGFDEMKKEMEEYISKQNKWEKANSFQRIFLQEPTFKEHRQFIENRSLMEFYIKSFPHVIEVKVE